MVVEWGDAGRLDGCEWLFFEIIDNFFMDMNEWMCTKKTKKHAENIIMIIIIETFKLLCSMYKINWWLLKYYWHLILYNVWKFRNLNFVTFFKVVSLNISINKIIVSCNHPPNQWHRPRNATPKLPQNYIYSAKQRHVASPSRFQFLNLTKWLLNESASLRVLQIIN